MATLSFCCQFSSFPSNCIGREFTSALHVPPLILSLPFFSPDFQLGQVKTGFSQLSAGFPLYLMSITRYYWVLSGFTEFYRVLLGFTGFYWVLLGFTGCYWVLLGVTGFYWVLLGSSGFYWVLLGFSGFYWVLPGFTGLQWVSPDGTDEIGVTVCYRSRSWTTSEGGAFRCKRKPNERKTVGGKHSKERETDDEKGKKRKMALATRRTPPPFFLSPRTALFSLLVVVLHFFLSLSISLLTNEKCCPIMFKGARTGEEKICGLTTLTTARLYLVIPGSAWILSRKKISNQTTRTRPKVNLWLE